MIIIIIVITIVQIAKKLLRRWKQMFFSLSVFFCLVNFLHALSLSLLFSVLTSGKRKLRQRKRTKRAQAAKRCNGRLITHLYPAPGAPRRAPRYDGRRSLLQDDVHNDHDDDDDADDDSRMIHAPLTVMISPLIHTHTCTLTQAILLFPTATRTR